MERIEQIREGRSFRFEKSSLGRRHVVRIFLLLFGAITLAWYINTGGGNMFTRTYSVNVIGSGAHYTVVTEPDIATWKSVDIFGDESVEGALMTFLGTTVLVCDSAILKTRGDSLRSQYRERIDLMVIPPTSEDGALRIREQFRPRMLAIAPPCSILSMQNIICEEGADTLGASFNYAFEVRGSKLRYMK